MESGSRCKGKLIRQALVPNEQRRQGFELGRRLTDTDNMQFLIILLAIFAIVGISFLMINVGYLLRKREFRGGCASNNPMIKDKFGACSVCGKTEGEPCGMPEKKVV
jgi:hypothetical protein